MVSDNGLVLPVHYREKTMSGKGSAPRPFSNREFYEAEMDRIFGKKNKEGQGESQPDSENGQSAEKCQADSP
jgi:hypothetical protein